MSVIITTRPLEDALIDAEILASSGITCLTVPMLEIHPLDIDLDQLHKTHEAEAVALTSRHAMKLILPSAWSTKPLFCVGESTAKLAHDALCTEAISHVKTGSGDGRGLVDLIAKSEYKSIFWPSGVDVSFDLIEPLASHGITTMRHAIYEAIETNFLPDEVIAALSGAGQIAVMIYSGRAGVHFTELLRRHDLDAFKSRIDLIVVSSRVAGQCGIGWRRVRVAAGASRVAMIEAVRQSQDSEDE